MDVDPFDGAVSHESRSLAFLLSATRRDATQGRWHRQTVPEPLPVPLALDRRFLERMDPTTSPLSHQLGSCSGRKRARNDAVVDNEHRPSSKPKPSPAKVAAEAFGAGGAPAASLPSPPPAPPNPRRYWALWDGFGQGLPSPNEISAAERSAGASADSNASNEGSSSSSADSHEFESPRESPSSASSSSTTVPSLDVLLRERELVEYNAHMKKRMEACQRKIDSYQRKMKEVREEMDTIEKKLHVATTLPRLFRYKDDDDFWNHFVPPSVKYDADLAGLIFQCCGRRDSDDLPIQFLKMLWMDPNCPLRNNRTILLATLGRIGVKDVQIVLSQEMASDRELVRACFANCPQCLQADDGRGNGGVPLSYLSDMAMLRALAFSDGARFYRSDRCDTRSGIHHQFSKELWTDPNFMADLIVHMCRSKYRHEERLTHDIVDKAFEDGIGHEQQPLLDDADFALRVAGGMVGVPYPNESPFSRTWPVTYRMLSPRLQATPEVALAFVHACERFVLDVPQLLRQNEPTVWFELWKAATESRPSLVYSKSLDAKLRSRLLACKELVMRLLLEGANEAGTADKAKSLDKFARLFPHVPPDIKADREINVQMILLCATPTSTKLRGHVAPEWLHRRDFWVDLAENHHCPCSTWGLVPADVARDDALIQAWARHAHSDGRIDWIASAVDNFPDLDLLSDRHVLLNRMTELCGDDPRAKALFRRISPDILADKSLWLVLLSKGGSCDYFSHMPEQLRHDVDMLDMLLKNSGSHFPERYLKMPVDLQRQFVHRLVEAIQGCEDKSFDDMWGGIYTSRDLMRVPEVAYASMAKGWRRFSDEFRDIVRGMPWRDDPEFLLSMARNPPQVWNKEESFWWCCSPRLRRDKEFLLRVLMRGKALWQLERYFDADLQKDFDIRCFVFLREAGWSCTSNVTPDLDLAREARRRLAVYVSLETFMEGVKSGRSSRPQPQQQEEDRDCAPVIPASLTMLNQDGYTLADLRGRLRELLGAPSDDEAAVVRKVSNVFTRNGY